MGWLEIGVAEDLPASRVELVDHELVEARDDRRRDASRGRRLGSDDRDVRAAPLGRHLGENAEPSPAGGEVAVGCVLGQPDDG